MLKRKHNLSSLLTTFAFDHNFASFCNDYINGVQMSRNNNAIYMHNIHSNGCRASWWQSMYWSQTFNKHILHINGKKVKLIWVKITVFARAITWVRRCVCFSIKKKLFSKWMIQTVTMKERHAHQACTKFIEKIISHKCHQLLTKLQSPNEYFSIEF